jgi:hypothetical protein
MVREADRGVSRAGDTLWHLLPRAYALGDSLSPPKGLPFVPSCPRAFAVLVIDKRDGRLRGFSHVSLFHVVRIEPANGSARRPPRKRTPNS